MAVEGGDGGDDGDGWWLFWACHGNTGRIVGGGMVGLGKRSGITSSTE